MVLSPTLVLWMGTCDCSKKENLHCSALRNAKHQFVSQRHNLHWWELPLAQHSATHTHCMSGSEAPADLGGHLWGYWISPLSAWQMMFWSRGNRLSLWEIPAKAVIVWCIWGSHWDKARNLCDKSHAISSVLEIYWQPAVCFASCLSARQDVVKTSLACGKQERG